MLLEFFSTYGIYRSHTEVIRRGIHFSPKDVTVQ